MRDVDEIAGIVAEAAVADGDVPFELPLIDRLARLVPADRAGYYEFDIPMPSACVNRFDVKQPGPGEPEWQSEEMFGLMKTYPLIVAEWSWPRPSVSSFSYGLTRKQRDRNPYYQLVMRCGGFDDELRLWIPAGRRTVRAFFFVREIGRRHFDERDHAVLTALHSHLGSIRERWERRHRPPGLTVRETEVLRLLRDGLTNKEVAARLVISQGTVRSHLENIFEKLGVHTRTAAVARAFGLAAP